MSVLSLLKKVKVQTLSFEKHPCRELDQEVMVHYLNGLALITNEDEKVCEKEREYLSILINSFGLNEDILETFVNFAENPDEKLILDMMQSFATKDIKYNFMVDCMMIASIDGILHKNEKAVIEQYFEMFKITKAEARDLKYIYKMFYTQDGNALYRYFKRNEYMKVELFQYLLDYYKIDMAYELVEDEKKILTFEFFKPTFTSGSLGNGATEIMTKPVNNAQFCIYLNSAFMDKAIAIDGNGKVIDNITKDIIMDLDNSDIEFEENLFLVNSNEDEEKKVTGVTYVIAELFIEWISLFNKEEYQMTHFCTYSVQYGDYRKIDLTNFEKNSLSNEIFYATDEYNSDSYYYYFKNNIDYNQYTNRKDHANKIDETNYIYSFRMIKLPHNE